MSGEHRHTAALVATFGLATFASAGERPAFQTLRFDEDWSEYEASGEDLWDPIKHVNLNEDGSDWASFGGELRLRGEYWENYGFDGAAANDNDLVLGRALFHGDFHFGSQVRLFVEGRSALVTDRDLPGGRRTIDEDTIGVQNAFGEIIVNVDDTTTLTWRVGRQELEFGSGRLVGPDAWTNTARSWDAARVELKSGGWRIDGFYSRYAGVKKYEFNDWHTGPTFYGVYASGEPGGGIHVDGYWFALDRRTAAFNGSSGQEDRHTLGARVWGAVPDTGFGYDAEGAYQFGEVGGADVSASMFAAEAGYTFGGSAARPRVYVGFDWASGDGTAGDGDAETFNQLFPDGHQFLGSMDFVGRQNIMAVSVGGVCHPREDWTVTLDGHWFRLDDTGDGLYDAQGGVVRPGGLSTSSDVGQEIDVTAAYRLNVHTTIEGGFGYFFAGEFLDESGGGKDMQWVYLQGVYRF